MQPYGLLEGCLYEDLVAHTKVFNLHALDEYIWILLPSWIRNYTLKSIHDISGQLSENVEFDETDVRQDYPRPWLRISKSLLKVESGQHTYKLDFRTEPETEDSPSIFISYIIQDNNPKTPYIYMPNRGNPDTVDPTEYNYTEEYVTDD